MDHFGIDKHTIEYDNPIKDKERILAILKEKLTTIKCNFWEENSTWIMSNYKSNKLVLNIIFRIIVA